MVDIASFTAEECSVDDVVLVQAEIVAVPDPKLTVCNLTFVRDRVSNFLTHVLNDYVFGVQSTQTINQYQTENSFTYG